MKLLEPALFIIGAIFLYKFLFYLIKRITLHAKIRKIEKEKIATVKYIRSPIASLFRTSDTPDLVIEEGKTVYVCRIVSGVSGFRFVHFANSEYYVRYTKMRFFIGGRLRIKAQRGQFLQGASVYQNNGSSATTRRSVKILPPLNMPEEYKIKSEFDDRKIIPVLIFNPAPCEVTYVTPSKTKIQVAFTGDDFYGYKIFTASTLKNYIEREKRNKEYEAKRIFMDWI